MTRRPQVVRSSSRAGPSAYRDLSSTIIHCYKSESGAPGLFATSEFARLPVEARDPFQRFFVSATLDDVRAHQSDGTPDLVRVRLCADTMPFMVVSSGPIPQAPSGPRDARSLTVTGVIDLQVGSHAITVEIIPGSMDGSVIVASVFGSVIEGQIVMNPGCAGGPVSNAMGTGDG